MVSTKLCHLKGAQKGLGDFSFSSWDKSSFQNVRWLCTTSVWFDEIV